MLSICKWTSEEFSLTDLSLPDNSIDSISHFPHSE